MEKANFENSIEVLQTLVMGLGAGLSVWGTIQLTEAYKAEAEFEQLTEEHRSRISEIGVLLERLNEDYENSKISAARFTKLFEQYESEENELYADIAELKAGIAAQKKQSVEQILASGRVAAISFMMKDLDALFALKDMEI